MRRSSIFMKLLAHSAFVCGLFAPTLGFAEVKVAFFQRFDEHGVPRGIEPGGRFYHVAILHEGRWLHSDLWEGVELRDTAHMQKKFGPHVEVLVAPDLTGPSRETVGRFLGLKFDSTYSWDRPGTTYCSKLVADLLGVPPRPKKYRGAIVDVADERPGELGISPDDLHRELLKRGFKTAVPGLMCQRLFTGPG